MSTQQYLRAFSCLVGTASGDAIEFSDFRVTFQVRRGDFQNPNTADVRIWNLSAQTAATIASKEFTQIALQAGYEGSLGLIFRGTITQARIGRESQLDSYVDITAADGDEAYNYSPMAISLAASATDPTNLVQQFLQTMARAGVTQGYIPDLSTNALPRGQVFYGNCRDELRQFAKDNDIKWSIQDGKLTLIPNTSYIPGTVPEIGPLTGLIGVPEQIQNGLSMKMLLNPQVKIGSCIRLNSNAVNQYRFGLDKESLVQNVLTAGLIKLNADGLYYVMTANHSGDTRGNDWYTDVVCLAVDATVSPKLADDAVVNAGAASIKRY